MANPTASANDKDLRWKTVSHRFVATYYDTLKSRPSDIHKFYLHESNFAHTELKKGGRCLERSVQGSAGVDGCIQKLYPPGSITSVDIINIEGQQIEYHSDRCYELILTQVSGQMYFNDVVKKFFQTFVLKEVAKDKFYVKNDIMKFFVDNPFEFASKTPAVNGHSVGTQHMNGIPTFNTPPLPTKHEVEPEHEMVVEELSPVKPEPVKVDEPIREAPKKVEIKKQAPAPVVEKKQPPPRAVTPEDPATLSWAKIAKRNVTTPAVPDGVTINVAEPAPLEQKSAKQDRKVPNATTRAHREKNNGTARPAPKSEQRGPRQSVQNGVNGNADGPNHQQPRDRPNRDRRERPSKPADGDVNGASGQQRPRNNFHAYVVVPSALDVNDVKAMLAQEFGEVRMAQANNAGNLSVSFANQADGEAAVARSSLTIDGQKVTIKQYRRLGPRIGGGGFGGDREHGPPRRFQHSANQQAAH